MNSRPIKMTPQTPPQCYIQEELKYKYTVENGNRVIQMNCETYLYVVNQVVNQEQTKPLTMKVKLAVKPTNSGAHHPHPTLSYPTPQFGHTRSYPTSRFTTFAPLMRSCQS